jgi:hypothetical protein
MPQLRVVKTPDPLRRLRAGAVRGTTALRGVASSEEIAKWR